MATIKHYKEDALKTGEFVLYENEPSVGQWIVDNMAQGQAFSVFSGQPCAENAIELRPEVLATLPDGEYIVINTPAGVTAAFAIIAVVVAVAVVALTPQPDLPKNVNRQQESPNNRLSSRSNQARPLQRIPDIKGRLLSIPDVIMPTYFTYESNKRVEHGYYCVGRKQYSISDVKDADTPISLITGAGAGIYYPGNNPNNASPDVQIGSIISRDIFTPHRANEVNGIALPADNAEETVLSQDIISATSGFRGPFGESFAVGSDMQLIDCFTQADVDVSGIYGILTRTLDGGDAILTVTPSVPGISGLLKAGGFAQSGGPAEFTDWVYMTREKASFAILNVTAQNGLYKDDGGVNLITATVDYQYEIQEVDDTDAPIGAVTVINDSVSGATQSLVGKTTEHEFTNPIKFRIRAKRTTPRDAAFAGTVVDQIQWGDCYALSEIDALHDFGDVTTIQTKTIANPFATAVKERQLNCIATELLNVYEGAGVFSPSLTENTNAIQSFIKDSIDPVIGNRQLSEIDADGLLQIDSDITAYFGTTDNNQFSYTYDSTDVSYQDYAQQVLNAINCIGYRDGSIIKAIFERPVTSPAMLFTHRSKIPGSERHSRNFNQSELYDGLEFNWVDPLTNTTETIYLPSDKTAVNPRQFNIPGIRNMRQAIIRSEREFNKIRLQKLTLDVSVTGEGRYVLPSDVIAVVKGSRVYTEDGEILAQNGLTLTLSQDVVFVMGDVHSITLKNDDGTTENIIVTAGAEANQVVLGVAPTTAIRTGIESRRTEFSFGNDARKDAELWLAQEIDISDKLQVGLKAINYALGYYAGDGVNLSAYSDGFDEGFG